MEIKTKNRLKTFVLCAILFACAFFLCFPGAATAVADGGRTVIEKPTLDVSLVYDGTAKTVTVEKSKYYVADSVTCVNAGVYTVTVALLDKNQYCWDDMTTDDLELEFEIKQAVFDESTLVYSDQTYVWDGKEHYINVDGLPSSASVVFNTVKSDPGVYDSVVRIDLGKNYSNRIVNLSGAKLTILAVELKDDGGSFISENGFDPDMQFSLGKGQTADFLYSLPAGGGLYATYSPRATLYGSPYDFGKGEYTFRLLVPSRYTGVRVYVRDGNSSREVPVRWDGHYLVFGCDEMCEFAVVYSGLGDEGQSRLLWLEILLGVLIIVEIAFIIKQTVDLKKK